MAILPTSAERAQNNVTKAEATVTEWQAKAAAVRAEAAELDATAGAAILEDESAADRISLQVISLQRRARAYDQAAAEAGKNLRTARRAALTAEAEALEKEADSTRKRAEKQQAAVEKLQAQLEELDGGKWERAELTDESTRSTTVTFAGNAAGIFWEAITTQTKAQCIRYWLKHGQLPADLRDLNKEFGEVHEISYMAHETYELGRNGDPITENLRAAVDTGLNL